MHPKEIQQQLQKAYQLLQQGYREEAEQIGHGILARAPGQPETLHLLGQIEQARGEFDKALRLYQRGLKSAPQHLHLLNSAGWVEKELGNDREAESLFRKALEIDPQYYYARQNLGVLFQQQQKYDEAKRLYLEVIRQQPRQADALANLSSILEKQHDTEAAKRYAERAMEVAPNHYVARLTLANVAARHNEYAQVIDLLTPLLQAPHLPPMDRATLAGKCAFAHESLGNHEMAFILYRGANELLHRHYQPAMQNADLMYSPAAFRSVEKAISEFDFSTGDEQPESPVFLIGFPRSGTTLLDQILSSHSRITVLEEKPNLVDAFEAFPANEAGLKALQNADEDTLQALRRAYWSRVEEETGAEQRSAVTVDKMPLNAFALLHISKLFPAARIIVALRDPRDCVFSAFQQKFGMNAAMFQMLRLETAAAFYDQVMNVIVGVHEASDLPMHFIRYEEVIVNFDDEVRPLIEFLGLAWEDALRDYQSTARARDVATPSASQVIQPLYASSIGKWKHFEQWIGSSFESLDKWVEKWGYAR
ncbi:MAG: sulfotransferase [Lysobacterales bacterium]|jgi:tetratricopeptide (TPR) repeat protein